MKPFFDRIQHMSEKLKPVLVILKRVALALAVFVKHLFKQRVRFPIVLILIIIFFWLGGAASKSGFGENVRKTTVSSFKQIQDIKINVTQANLAGTIKISGKQAPSPENKKYLVVFTSVENASASAKQVTYADFFRLDENGKKIPPLPLNASFTIPPKASLEKQLIFLVDKGKKAFKLLVGPLEGSEPEQVELRF